jgi:peptide/nickel transport system permease protein
MTRYLASRFAGMVIVMLLVATIVFFITRLAPGDPAAVMLGEQATAADIAKLRASYGLDQPLPLQFVYWLGELAHGNLGQSIFLQRPVTQALAERAEPTFFLTLFSILIATLIGVPCGIIAAVWRGKPVDQFFSGFAMLGASIPSFWFGLILMQIFAVALGWFPVAGYGDPGVPLSDRLHHLVLPSIVLGVVNSALILRFTRASMLDDLSDDHIRTARAKGLSSKRHPAPCAAQRADPGDHRARPHVRPADRRRDRDRNRLRPARRRQPGRFRRPAPRLSGDPGRAAGDRGTLRSHQSGDRPAVPGRRSAREVLNA